MGMHIKGPLYVSGVPTSGSGSRVPATTGNVFFVDSGSDEAADNTERGKTVEQPFATIDYAVGRCTASNGDVIIVMPGHVETLTTAGGGSAGLDLDVAGIHVVGLGVGRNRPRIDMGTVAGTDIDVDAANITLENVYIDMTLLAAGLTAAIDVNAADFTLKDCEVVTADAGGEAILGIIVTGDRCTIEGNTFRGSADIGTTAQIDLDGTNDGLVIRNNTFLGACSAANIQASTAHTNVLIEGNHLENFTGAAHIIEFTAAVTGTIRYNTCITSIYGNAIDPGSCACFENYWYDSNLLTSDLSGIIVPESLAGGGAAAAADIVISGKFPPLGPTSDGNIFYVDSNNGGSSNSGTSPVDAISTLVAAVALCTADQGDIIYVMPDHTEALDGTSDIDVNIAGVSIIGLGNGVKRPEYTYTTAVGATLTISANNVRLVNYYFDITAFDEIVAGITVTGLDCTIERCEFLMADGSGQAEGAITTNAHRTKVKDCVFRSPNAGAQDAFEVASGTPDGVVVTGCTFTGDFTNGAIQSAAAFTNCRIENNTIQNTSTGNHAIQLAGAATGFIVNNVVSTDNIGTSIDPGSCMQSGNTFLDSSNNTQDKPASNLPVPRGGLDGWNFLLNSIDLTTGGTTTETVAEHEVFTVTGLVRCKLLVYISTDVTSGGTPDFDLGVTGDTNMLQTRLIDMTSMDAPGILQVTGAASIAYLFNVQEGGAVDLPIREFLSAGADIGYTIVDDACTAGILEFCLWWAPISNDGLVVAADGSAGAI